MRLNIRLRLNEDIQIHNPPSSDSNNTLLRPILKDYSSQPSLHHMRSCASSQTDITAVSPDSGKQAQRDWSSDPILSQGHQNSVSFRVPEVEEVLRVDKDYREKGRYTILNRDFTPKGVVTGGKNGYRANHSSILSSSYYQYLSELDVSNSLHENDLSHLGVKLTLTNPGNTSELSVSRSVSNDD